jgi:hypothetical protein
LRKTYDDEKWVYDVEDGEATRKHFESIGETLDSIDKKLAENKDAIVSKSQENQ